MTTTTAGAVIQDGFRHAGMLGVGQALGGNMLADGLRQLNLMCDSLGLGPQFAYTKTSTVFSLPAGTSSRTIGPAMQVAVDRPWRIEQSSFVRVDGIDYPLTPVSRAEYNALADKALDGPWPRAVFFDGGYPTGNLYFWPLGACEVHLDTLGQVGQFSSATATVYLPQGYEDMLSHQLALRLCSLYEVEPSKALKDRAWALLAAVKRSNHEVPQMDGAGLVYDDTTSQLFGL